MRILVTGGTAILGTHLLPALRARGHEVTVLTRQPGVFGGVPGDLARGEGLLEACQGVEAIIHAASSQRSAEWRTLDIAGTAALASAARQKKVPHLLYVSILGADQVPLPYYKAKMEAEAQLRHHGVAHTIMRIAQFHELLDSALHRIPRIGVGKFSALPIPSGLTFQPIASQDAAQVIADRIEFPPSSKAELVGGPEILTGEEITASWLKAHGQRAKILQTPLTGRIVQSIADGGYEATENAFGSLTFDSWVHEHAGQGHLPAYFASARTVRRAQKN